MEIYYGHGDFKKFVVTLKRIILQTSLSVLRTKDRLQIVAINVTKLLIPELFTFSTVQDSVSGRSTRK